MEVIQMSTKYQAGCTNKGLPGHPNSLGAKTRSTSPAPNKFGEPGGPTYAAPLIRVSHPPGDSPWPPAKPDSGTSGRPPH